MEYSNGWRLSNGKRIFLPFIIRERETLKEVRRFLNMDQVCTYLEKELKVESDQIRMSRDPRFLFETQSHYVERLG